MSRILRVGIVAVCVALLAASPVAAAKPVQEIVPVNNIGIHDDGLSDFCGFDVWFDETGHIVFRTFVDAEGNAIREVNNFALAVRYYSEFGEVNVVDVGPDRVTYLEDGSLLVSITGHVQSITAPGQGRVYDQDGWRTFLVTFDSEGNVTSFELVDSAGQHSDFDQAEVICDLLAG